jgi:hypothetical protein
MEQRGIRERLAHAKVDTLVSQSAGKLTSDDVMRQKADEMSATDSDLKNLIREYYEVCYSMKSVTSSYGIRLPRTKKDWLSISSRTRKSTIGTSLVLRVLPTM